MSVETLYAANARDIPAMLRKRADDIEELGEKAMPTAVIAVEMGPNGEIEIFGWGDVTAMDAIAILEFGKARMVEREIGGSA